jgi:gliding motility-associated-like protein
MMLRFFGLLAVALLWMVPGRVQAQSCPLDTNPRTPTACFRVYDPATGLPLDVPGQPVTVLCAGSRIRLKDCSGEGFALGTIFYSIGCSSTGSAQDTATFRTVPNTPGQLLIQQNTPNPHPGAPGFPMNAAGVQYTRVFEVRNPPAPNITFNYCGTGLTQVYVTITNPQANTQYQVQVGNGPRQPVTNPAGAVYTANGPGTIVVYGRYRDAPNACEGPSNTLTLGPQPAPVAPQLQRLTVQSSGLDLAFAPLQAEYRYVLEQDAGSGFQRLTDIPASATSYTVAGGSLTSCYRLRLTDACGTLSLPSAPLCPVDLRVSSANRENQLQWVQPAGSPVTGYEVLRDQRIIGTLPSTAREYLDQNVTCGVTYRYRVVARSAGGASESLELPLQTVATQAAPAPALTASFRLDNAVEIRPAGTLRDPDSRLLVRRSLGGAAPQDVPVPAQLPVVDQPGAVTPGQVPCYAARLSDPCGNVSNEGPSACPPVLEAKALDREGNQIGLTWAEPNGQGSGWRYRLLLLDADNRELSSSALSPGTFPVLAPVPPADRQVLRYRLEATSSTNTVVYSNVATVKRQLVVVIPTAFTPNGDGLNDVLEIKGRFLKTFNFTVFDRSGLVVFRATERTQTWDGRIRGVQAAPQVFPFQFETTDETGQRFVQRGTVTLLR